MTDETSQGHTLFVQFAGQGVKYMDELRQLYARYAHIRPFIHEAIAEIKKQASLYDDADTNFFKWGLDVDRWIEHPEQTPELGYLLSSTISHPLIYLTQISNYISFVQDSVDQEKLLRHTHSTTGFSTGVVASLLFSLGLPMDELFNVALKVQAMFFWQGVRCQESMLEYGSKLELDMSLYKSEEGSPSCMATVTNVLRRQLDELIAAFSEKNGKVYLAYELYPGRYTVSGLPEDLAEFGKFLKDHKDSASLRFVPSTIGAHSPFLSYALEKSPADIQRIGLEFRTQDLKIPVWSNNMGTDLRESDNIMQDVITSYFVLPGTWRKQILPLVPPSNINYVLDFGPGSGVASLTWKHISNTNIQVINCSMPIGRKMFFDEVLPILEDR